MFLDRDGIAEPVGGMLRPGNATANNVVDQLAVIDQAIGQLPERYRQGHSLDGKRVDVDIEITVRLDSAGDGRGMLTGLAERNLGFLVSGSANGQLATAIAAIAADDWTPAYKPARQGLLAAASVENAGHVISAVAEITDTVAIGHLPAGTRVIVRREHRHQGAKLRLFETPLYRYQIVYTNLDGSCVDLEYDHRCRARAEQQNANLKNTGADHWPFESWQGNVNWFGISLLAQTLISWIAHGVLPARLGKTHPKKLRFRLFSAPGRIIRHARQIVLRIPTSWAWHADLAYAYKRLNLTR